ncbi:TPA: hypothetical protein R4S64_003673 [Kluyvera georgiana]|nr:hypothetical protein [Kluyvera georgiana]
MPSEPLGFYFDNYSIVSFFIGSALASAIYLIVIWLMYRRIILMSGKSNYVHRERMASEKSLKEGFQPDGPLIQEVVITIWASSSILTRDVVCCLNNLADIVKTHPFPDSSLDGQIKQYFNGDLQYTIALKPYAESSDYFPALQPAADFLLPHASVGRYFILKSQCAGKSSATSLALFIRAAGRRIAEGEKKGSDYFERGFYAFRVEPAPYIN